MTLCTDGSISGTDFGLVSELAFLGFTWVFLRHSVLRDPLDGGLQQFVSQGVVSTICAFQEKLYHTYCAHSPFNSSNLVARLCIFGTRHIHTSKFSSHLQMTTSFDGFSPAAGTWPI